MPAHALRSILPVLVFAACTSGDPLGGDGCCDPAPDRPEVSEPCPGYVDSDGDTIADSMEGTDDLDGDTIPNHLDTDSDGDTISDAIEAGDDDLCNHPRNTDWGCDSEGDQLGDSQPDFLDTDSDDDGVPDADEVELGTDPYIEDTDGDGVTDLGEVAYGSDPQDPSSTMDPDDIFAILKYLASDHDHRDLETSNTGTTVVDINVTAEDEPRDPATREYDSTVFIKDATPIPGEPPWDLGYSHEDETFFYGVEPGTEIRFEIDLYNNTIPPADTAQAFKAWIVVLGDGEVELDRHMVLVVVPTAGKTWCP